MNNREGGREGTNYIGTEVLRLLLIIAIDTSPLSNFELLGLEFINPSRKEEEVSLY